MRIVITGASGNVGTALLRVLGAEHEIVGVVRRPACEAGRLRAGQLVFA
jgi:UDP-glucose 4-epimerase